MRTKICCAHAGGQGKTTVAQTLYAASKAKGVELSLAAADFKDESHASKLGRLFPGEVREFGTGPSVDLAKQSNDLNANVQYWDSLGPTLMKGGAIIDMGANVIDQLLHWGKIRRAPTLLKSRSAPPIDVFLVCKAEQRAVDDMSDLVKRFGAQDALPVENIYIVLNEQGGNFDGLDLRSKIVAADADANVQFIEFPKCTSELWVPMEQRYISLERVMTMEEDEIPESLGVDMWSVLSGIDDINEWFVKVQNAFKSVNAI